MAPRRPEKPPQLLRCIFLFNIRAADSLATWTFVLGTVCSGSSMFNTRGAKSSSFSNVPLCQEASSDGLNM